MAQMPNDLLGKWSTNQKSCEGNQDEGVTVFDIGALAIGWYEMDCDIKDVRTQTKMEGS